MAAFSIVFFCLGFFHLVKIKTLKAAGGFMHFICLLSCQEGESCILSLTCSKQAGSNCHTLLLEKRKPSWEGDGNYLLRQTPWCKNGQSCSICSHLCCLSEAHQDLQTEHLRGLQQCSCIAGSVIFPLWVSFPWISFSRQWLCKQDKHNLMYSRIVYWLMLKEEVTGTNTF